MIRIWMTPTDLGEAGYHIDIVGVTAVHKLKNGDLLLMADVDDPDSDAIGRSMAGRYDTFVFMDDPEPERPKRPVKAAAKKAPAKKTPAKKIPPRKDTK